MHRQNNAERAIQAHMDKKLQAELTLTELCQEVGVPNRRIHTDGAKELTLRKWGEKVRELAWTGWVPIPTSLLFAVIIIESSALRAPIMLAMRFIN
eukprot:scaffold177373_cov42-Attheya_sp.AAC.2